MATPTSVDGIGTADNGEDNATQPLFTVPFYEDCGWGGCLRQSVHLQSTVADTATAVSRAAQHHSKLQQAIEVLKGMLSAVNITSLPMEQTLKELESSASEIQEFINSCVASIPPAFMPSEKSAVKAQQVFSTAELVEEIFSNLTPFETLSAMQMTRATSQIFADSPRLQDKLHLRPLKNQHYATIFQSPTDVHFRVSLSTEPEPWGSPTPSPRPDAHLQRFIAARFDWASCAYKLGTTCRRILICQPPIYEMQVLLDCCPDAPQRRSRSSTPVGWGSPQPRWRSRGYSKSTPDAVRVVKSDTGLTVGDLHDMCERLREEHRHCPNASVDMHTYDGTVQVRVGFQTSFTMSHSDPEVKRISDRRTRQQLSRIQTTAAFQRMDVYVQAKKTAHANGWKIPTLEEFNANYAAQEDTGDMLY